MARYIAGCSCLVCCDSWREYQREWKRDTARLMDSEPVRRHMAMLRHNGWRTRGIAEQSGVCYSTVRNLREGNYPRVNRDSAACIMELSTVPLATDSTALVPARPTLLRIERLRRSGHSLEAIAAEVGVSRKSLPQAGQRSVQARTAKRVEDAATRLKADARREESHAE